MSRQDRITQALEEKFSPEHLDVIDESHLHAGHGAAGAEPFDGGGETHFRVRLVSPSFAGQSRVDRHRSVNDALKRELDQGLHALAIEAAAPGEKVRWRNGDPGTS